jgi:ankyrin repeat protein
MARNEGTHNEKDLFSAIIVESPASVRRLLEGGADLEQRDEEGNTALGLTVGSSIYDDITQLLLSFGSDPNRATGKYKTLPLNKSAFSGSYRAVEMLLKAGADPRKADPDGETAVMSAAKHGRKAIIRLLLEAGAEVNARDKDGRNAVSWTAVWGNYPSTIELLLDAGADVDPKDAFGLTPFLSSLAYGRTSAAWRLFRAGANPKTVDNEGRSALMYAAEVGDARMVRALMKAGAPLDAVDQYGKTAQSRAKNSDIRAILS